MPVRKVGKKEKGSRSWTWGKKWAVHDRKSGAALRGTIGTRGREGKRTKGNEPKSFFLERWTAGEGRPLAWKEKCRPSAKFAVVLAGSGGVGKQGKELRRGLRRSQFPPQEHAS